MAQVTYHVVLPFSPDADGNLMPGEPQEAPNAHLAVVRAQRLVATKGGAVAFSRTGDPALGDYQEGVLLGRFGNVPDDLAEHMSG